MKYFWVIGVIGILMAGIPQDMYGVKFPEFINSMRSINEFALNSSEKLDRFENMVLNLQSFVTEEGEVIESHDFKRNLTVFASRYRLIIPSPYSCLNRPRAPEPEVTLDDTEEDNFFDALRKSSPLPVVSLGPVDHDQEMERFFSVTSQGPEDATFVALEREALESIPEWR